MLDTEKKAMQRGVVKPMTREVAIAKPVWRRLRVYAFDPSLSSRLDTASVNEVIVKVRWEEDIQPGPVGEYIEVIDIDPASQKFYLPVNLNDPYILAQDGLDPSEGNPKFHQQMVYAIAMKTIQNFERGLGRVILWQPYLQPKKNGITQQEDRTGGTVEGSVYVQRLRIYPHALRQANAYYAWQKKAVLFGYFPSVNEDPTAQFPGGTVFTCLSHDVITHEVTHAILDGMHRRYLEPTNPDCLAFHEAFADIVALFQHFTYAEVVSFQIAKTRGDLGSQNLLGELAYEVGRALGQYGALRDAIGKVDPITKKWEPLKPNAEDYQTILEEHDRGAILVGTIFDAFLTIYRHRIADLIRIASSGSGVLPEGSLHPDLVTRLADEATKASQHILNMCIRALDYCPPVDITFGEFLRAMLTADRDLVPDDDKGYRLALLEAFRRRGIYPHNVRTFSIDSLVWEKSSDCEMYTNLMLGIDPKRLEILLEHKFQRSKRNNGSKTELQRAALWKRLKRLKDQDKGKFLDTFRKEFRELLLMPAYLNREQTYIQSQIARELLHMLFNSLCPEAATQFENSTGIILNVSEDRKALGLRINDDAGEAPNQLRYQFEVHSVRRARRVSPDGELKNQVVVVLTQWRPLYDEDIPDEENAKKPSKLSSDRRFRGGCTMIFDYEIEPGDNDLHVNKLFGGLLPLRYVISKNVTNESRRKRQRDYIEDAAESAVAATYFGDASEIFTRLHQSME